MNFLLSGLKQCHTFSLQISFILFWLYSQLQLRLTFENGMTLIRIENWKTNLKSDLCFVECVMFYSKL